MSCDSFEAESWDIYTAAVRISGGHIDNQVYPGEIGVALRLGFFFETGAGGEPRLDLAFNWYNKGAYEENDRDCLLNLGRFYLWGIYVDRDADRGVRLLREAYMKGSFEAGIILGRAYLYGIGVLPSVDVARRYLLSASNMGYIGATYLLGLVECKNKRYFKGVRLMVRAIASAVKLSRTDPQSPFLYGLKEARFSEKTSSKVK